MGLFEENSSALTNDEAAIRFARESCIISVAPDNGPFKTSSLGGRRAHGRICSMKGKRSMPWEGRNERCEEVLACEAAEVDTNCLRWISQPCRIEMRDGSALILSIAKYYSPSGKAIQDAAVTPNVQVADVDEDAALPDEDQESTPPPVEKPKPTPQQDEQLQKAIQVLKAHAS